MSVYLLATLDTKGKEADYVRTLLENQGVATTLVDTGCIGEPAVGADVAREDVFQAAGTSLAELRRRGDRGEAVTKAAEGAARIVIDAHAAGKVSGIFGLGGSAGTTIATAAMRALPLGVPKVMVSTLASGDVRPFVGAKDIAMFSSVVDIAGLNRISRTILAGAAHAMAGMVRFSVAAAGRTLESVEAQTADKPVIAASMFGVTTPCVEHARKILEEAGYEVLVFHATGTGGQTMESLIRDGLIAGVLDITTTELADELVGGVLTAGPGRLTAAAERGVPQVVSVGACDMVNFWAIGTVPEQFRQRKLHKHNENVTLMRTTVEECSRIGREIAKKIARSQGPAVVLLPERGVSAIDGEGQPFDDPAARSALFEAIRSNLDASKIIERDEHINAPSFAEAAAGKLLELIGAAQPR